MQLNNLQLIDQNEPVNISIEDQFIRSITETGELKKDELSLDFTNAVAFPGLINSHDHLDFNLFPQLGNKLYTNYQEWGAYIHKQYKQQISEVLKVPLALRIQWGLYKNLLAGVTTVVNHGEQVDVDEKLVTVIQNHQCLHSVGFEKYWKLKLNNPFKKSLPVVIHTGEGTDRAAAKEIDELLKWNVTNRDLISVHGVAMDALQAKSLRALVWCPVSNFFLLNKTAEIAVLKEHTAILFGTDSTLTGDWNIWQHLRIALETHQLTYRELWESVTTTPAGIWNINSGILAAGRDADIVVSRVQNGKSAFNPYKVNPENFLLVTHRGKINIFDSGIHDQLIKQHFPTEQFDLIKIGETYKYVRGNIKALMQSIEDYYPQVIFPVTAA